jgi:hypothetical protein
MESLFNPDYKTHLAGEDDTPRYHDYNHDSPEEEDEPGNASRDRDNTQLVPLLPDSDR